MENTASLLSVNFIENLYIVYLSAPSGAWIGAPRCFCYRYVGLFTIFSSRDQCLNCPGFFCGEGEVKPTTVSSTL